MDTCAVGTTKREGQKMEEWQQLKKESRDDSQVHLHENIRDQARAEIRDCCW